MFFILSKIFWTLAQPLNALCLLGLIGAAVCIWCRRAGEKIILTAFSGVIVLGFFPTGPLLLTWLENRTQIPASLPEKIDGMIVLGGAFESHMSAQTGQISANDQIGRVLCFMQIAQKHREAKLIVSGGAGDILHPSAMEGDVARQFFALTRFDQPVLYEELSRNTYENAVFSQEMAKPQHGENWLLFTSAYHMPRSVGIFENLGWNVIPYPCDRKTDGSYKNAFLRLPNVTGNFHYLNLAIKEIIGIAIYAVTGKTALHGSARPVPSH